MAGIIPQEFYHFLKEGGFLKRLRIESLKSFISID